MFVGLSFRNLYLKIRGKQKKKEKDIKKILIHGPQQTGTCVSAFEPHYIEQVIERVVVESTQVKHLYFLFICFFAACHFFQI